MSSFLENALSPMRFAVALLKLPEKTIQKLAQPEHVRERDLEIEMGSGETKIFPAWRVQWSSVLGPYKGGIRFAQDANLDEVSALAALMTWKNSLLSLPLGGGKGAVRVDVREHSKGELERVARAYARAFFDELGPEKDIPAPDVHTNAEIIGYMSDEYNKIAGKSVPGAFTGKPLAMGGSKGREVSTSYGGFVVLKQYLAQVPKKGATVAIQGFGNVGSHLAQFLVDAGFAVVAVSDSQCALYKKEGLPIQQIQILQEGGAGKKLRLKEIAQKLTLETISNEALLELPVDVLVPAAHEGVIHGGNADRIKATLMLEMANGPVTKEADVILRDREVEVLPDILANGGGVMGSYFEMLQNKEGESWSEDAVLKKLKDQMIVAFNELTNTKLRFKVSYREAAYIRALERIAQELS